jgi:hypothetical protein
MRLFGFLNLFKQSNRKHFAIVVLSRMLIECSPAAARLRFPAILDPGFFCSAHEIDLCES